MKNSPEIMNQFYQNLGKLFYSMAAIDGRVEATEIDSLKKLVVSSWLDIEGSNDSFGSDAAFQIEIVFDLLVEQNTEPEDCFKDFETFRKNHDSLFTKSVNEIIFNTCDTIAGSFAKKNKSELVLLSRLATVLGKN